MRITWPKVGSAACNRTLFPCTDCQVAPPAEHTRYGSITASAPQLQQGTPAGPAAAEAAPEAARESPAPACARTQSSWRAAGWLPVLLPLLGLVETCCPPAVLQAVQAQAAVLPAALNPAGVLQWELREGPEPCLGRQLRLPAHRQDSVTSCLLSQHAQDTGCHGSWRCSTEQTAGLGTSLLPSDNPVFASVLQNRTDHAADEQHCGFQE